MVREERNIDLNLLAEHFTECGDYTKGVILEELEYWRRNTDFLVLISESGSGLDGFLIGYRSRNSLWISQMWRRAGSDIKTSRKAIEKAKDWARARDMTSITGETKRNEMKAFERYGFVEESVNMICRL